jgi:hypothetical protein
MQARAIFLSGSNSPPRYPRYDGSVGCAQREIAETQGGGAALSPSSNAQEWQPIRFQA